MRNIEVNYISSTTDLPKPCKTVALFITDPEMKLGYDIVTGYYVEETIIVDGSYCIKPRFNYSHYPNEDETEILGAKVFAWAELPELDIEERWFHGRVRIS